MTSASVMVTGGAGYIGSHAVLALLRAGMRVVVIDDLSRGHRKAIERIIEHVPGGEARLVFIECDIADPRRVREAIRAHSVASVLHFAGLAVVGESVIRPLEYHRVNTAGSIALLETCIEAGVERFIFSSSAATYGIPDDSGIPIPESAPQRPISAYGRSKLAMEWALADSVRACRALGRAFSGAALRYFNVAGCGRDGVLGEDHDPESHLIPVVIRHLLGGRDRVTIFGDDYESPDGTCVRDYVHVDDLVSAHLAVLGALGAGECRAYNVGIGRGFSVREVIAAAERVSGRRCVVERGDRREGDPPVLCADASRLRSDLGWRPEFMDIEGIIETAWRWFSAHPGGYGAPASVGGAHR